MEQPQTAHKLSKKPRTIDVLSNDNIDFAGLLLSEPVLRGLKTAGFERPSPIQLKTIPLGRCGLDLIIQAKSGTGKTCVFSVVALESITCETNALQVLVLAPTREIAVQIWEVIKSIGCAVPGLRCYTFIGGLPVHDDIPKLRKCHIAVGTPGRVKQLIEQGFMDTDSIRLFVLDEADKLLEDSFQECINWIYSSLPDTKQMLALSATYPEALAQHVTAYMYNPTFVRLNTSDPALLGIRQYYKALPFHPMPQKVFDSKVKCLIKLLSSISFNQCLVFSNFQMRAESLSEKLNTKGWPSTFISGSQDQHHRLTAMAKLKKFHCRVLISTDLTSRGIDAENVNLVINIDLPNDHETYLHRIGRAGRFGSYGAAITLVCEGKEIEQLNNMESKCNTTICSLPEPIPEDLASSSGFINLDKYITTERIITKEDDSSSTRPSLRGMSHLIQNDQNKKTQVQIDSGSVQAASKTTSECKTTAFEQPNVQDLSKSDALSESLSKESIQNEANVPVHNDNARHDGKSNTIDSMPSGKSIQPEESTQPNTSNVKVDRKEKVMPTKTVHIRKNNPRAFSFQDLLGSYKVIDKPPKKEVKPMEAVIPQVKSDTVVVTQKTASTTNTTDSNSLGKSKIVSSTSALVKHSPSTRKIISFSAIQKDYESVPTEDDKDKPYTIYKEEYSPSGISFDKEDQTDIILKIKNSLLEQADRQTEQSCGHDAEEPVKSSISEVDAEASVDNIQVNDDKVPDQRPANNPYRDHHVTDGALCQSNVTDACSELSEEEVAVISCHYHDDIQATGHPIEKQSTEGESVSLQAYAAEVKKRMPADLTLGKEYVQLLGVQSSGEECDSSEGTSNSSSESDVSDSSDEEYVFYDAQDDNRKFRYTSNEHYPQCNQATASTRFPSNRFFPMSYDTDHSQKHPHRQHRHGYFVDPYMYSHWLNSVSSAVYSTQCYHAYMMHMMFTHQYQTLHQNIRSQQHLAKALAQHKKLVKSWMKNMHPHN